MLDKSFGADEELTGRVRIHGNYDVCLVSSMSVAPFYAEAFDQPLERFRSDLGIPRTDVLFGEERIARTVADLRRRYDLVAGRRVILYAPTFRGEKVDRGPFDRRPGPGPAPRAARRRPPAAGPAHPFIRRAAPIGPELEGFAIDVSDHPDINELLLVSDLLITDYSSVIYEFSLLGRPMVFFAPDYEAYERERGFYFEYRTGVPGPVFETTAPLAEAIRAGAFDLARVEAFRVGLVRRRRWTFDRAIRGPDRPPGHLTRVRYDTRPVPTSGAGRSCIARHRTTSTT